MNRRSKELVTAASENAEQMCPLILEEEHILRSKWMDEWYSTGLTNQRILVGSNPNECNPCTTGKQQFKYFSTF